MWTNSAGNGHAASDPRGGGPTVLNPPSEVRSTLVPPTESVTARSVAQSDARTFDMP